jgi:hypothetical protein
MMSLNAMSLMSMMSLSAMSQSAVGLSSGVTSAGITGTFTKLALQSPPRNSYHPVAHLLQCSPWRVNLTCQIMGPYLSQTTTRNQTQLVRMLPLFPMCGEGVVLSI